MKTLAHVSEQNAISENSASIGDLIESFLKDHDVKEVSRHGLRRRLRSFTKWLGNQPLSSIDRNTILEYKRFLIGRQLSSNTVNAYLVGVRVFMTWLETSRIYPNVATSVKGLKNDRVHRKAPLSGEQVLTLINSIKGEDLKSQRDRALVVLMSKLGPRTIEIVRAKVSDIRIQMGVTVLYLQAKGSDSKDSYVVLSESTLEPILRYLNSRENLNSDSPLFASLHDGSSLNTRSIRRIVRERLHAASLKSPYWTAHSLRHTAINLSLLGGASIFDVQTMVGHRDSQSIAAYARAIDRLSGNPEKAVDKYLEEVKSK